MKIDLILLLGALILAIQCSSPTTRTSSTETTNGTITGKIVDDKGLPEAGALVHLFDTGHVPAYVMEKFRIAGITDTSVFTDSHGDYAFSWPGPGAFNIIGESVKGLFVFIARVTIPDTTPVVSENKIGTDTVRLPGAIAGVSLLSGAGGIEQSRVRVYLSGTGLITAPAANGSFSVAKVPFGIYTLVIHPLVAGFGDTVLTVAVEPGKTTLLDTVFIVGDAGSVDPIVNDAPIVLGLSDTVISINDTATFSVNAADSDGVVGRYHWNFGVTGVKRFDTTESGTCTHKFPSTASVCTVTVSVADSLGKTGSQSAIVTVLRDPPVADAGPDTTVFVNSMYTVRGSGTDRFGKIVMFRFDTNEDGRFEDSSGTSGVKQFRAPLLAGSRVVILQVEDDDGNTSNSMMLLDVLPKQ